MKRGFLARGMLETLTLAREMAWQTAAQEVEWIRHRRTRIIELGQYLKHPHDLKHPHGAPHAEESTGWRSMLRGAFARLDQLVHETNIALAAAEARLRAARKDVNVAASLGHSLARAEKIAALHAEAAAITELCATRAAR